MEDSGDNGARIARIEFGRLTATRPRSAGANARRGIHGIEIGVPLLRITTKDGASGIGRGHIPKARAKDLLGTPMGYVFDEAGLVRDDLRGAEYAYLDLAGVRSGRPAYALAAEANGKAAPRGPLRVRCYDTSLYFDDLHLTEEGAAASLIANEARYGYDRGHRAFKIKVGRGNRYMDLDTGTRRDVAIIRAVREAVGTECELFIDANNGYNLNLAKHVLSETADCRLNWIEEAFHEDAELYGDLKSWLHDNGLSVRIADGEGDASPHLIHWAKNGLIDVIQYDVFGYGFSRWLRLGKTLDEMGVGSACHHYGAFCGNYVTGHLASGIDGFQFVEWDEATVPGLNAPGYTISEGMLTIPDVPGFGWQLEEPVFAQAVGQGDGYSVAL